MSKRILLKKLLDIDDRYMALNGLSFNKEQVQQDEEVDDVNFRFDIEKKENKSEFQKKISLKFVGFIIYLSLYEM